MSFTLLQTSKCDELGTCHLSHSVNFDVQGLENQGLVKSFNGGALKKEEEEEKAFTLFKAGINGQFFSR